MTAARALLEFTEQTIELPRDLICKLLSMSSRMFAHSMDENTFRSLACMHCEPDS